MADSNRTVPSHNEPGQTFENRPDELFNNVFQFPEDDFPIGENAVFAGDMNQFGHGTSQAGPSTGVNNDQSNSGNLNPGSPKFGSPIALLDWPDPPEPYQCSNCQVLREIIHHIDPEIRKFEIHGRVGLISHGILEICHGDRTAPQKEHHMFDFGKEAIPDIKTYLTQYCEERSEAGYMSVKDPLLAFNEALSVGSDWAYGGDFDDILGQSSTPRDENRGQQPEDTDQPNVSQPQAQSNNHISKRKRYNTRSTRPRNYQDQRVFVKGLELKDLVDYFHLTIEEAADKVGISITTLKNFLSRENFSWPGQEIRQLEKKIEKRSKDLNASTSRKRANAEANIEQWKQSIARFYAPFR